MMKLNTLEFIRLLPQFMRDDPAVQGLSKAIDNIIPQLADAAEKLSTWDHIDELSEAELDDLAWELNILWYDTSADISIKRDLVKNSDKVYQHLGTVWAVENVIEAYFGDGHIEEWFKYGGEPGRFRVHSNNPSVSSEALEEFLSVLNKVKRASAKLDEIIIDLSGQLVLSAGVAVHEIGHEVHAVGAIAP